MATTTAKKAVKSQKKTSIKKLRKLRPKKITWTSEWDWRKEPYDALPLKPDFVLLNDYIEWIEAEDAAFPNDGAECEWHQGAWAIPGLELAQQSYETDRDPETNICATSYCLAGKVAAETRSKFLVHGIARDEDVSRASDTEAHYHSDGTMIVTKNGKLIPVDYYAARRLGLDWDWAMSFFSGSNTATFMRTLYNRLVTKYRNGDIEAKTKPPRRAGLSKAKKAAIRKATQAAAAERAKLSAGA